MYLRIKLNTSNLNPLKNKTLRVSVRLYFNILNHYLGGFLLCGFIGTVFGPGLGLLGSTLGFGDGLDLLCGFIGTVFFAIFNLF